MPSKTSAKSAKAIKAAGKSAGSSRKGGGGGLGGKRQIPWLMIGAVVCILALIGGIAWVLVPKIQDKQEQDKFTPSAQKKDPSDQIPGVVKKDYAAGMHVAATQRVNYDQAPPFGGPHDGSWAACTGVVYAKAIRTENAVHSLEHGAVWITYNPDKVDQAAIDTLKSKVKGKPYSLMSPYPGLDTPISLQSWGHQLKLNSADDKRVGEFITALRLNQYAYPEVGADCANPTFNTDNPPPFDPTAPGPDAVPMDGKGLQQDSSELGGGIPGMPTGGIPGLPNGIPSLPTGSPSLPAGIPTIPAPTDGPTQPEQPAPAQ
ncbi:DUF3105 domain-containing protein [Nocardia aurantiaca]|uniref:DUF3105 domain-containing protein n=1 Tax=Nocardia aurantiaca TaxID=2675850 RepID=A0A6I3KSP1_9NOCA|nr:DUF3105 domain-containing protein [Nocardia aurantiaca]MTE11828.1 DUF3105 domain-containing protein [Nocardia aurantiaca]